MKIADNILFMDRLDTEVFLIPFLQSFIGNCFRGNTHFKLFENNNRIKDLILKVIPQDYTYHFTYTDIVFYKESEAFFTVNTSAKEDILEKKEERFNLYVSGTGKKLVVERMISQIEDKIAEYKIPERTKVNWFFNTPNGRSSVYVDLKPSNKISNIQYPYFNFNIDEFMNSYLKSDSPILILIGGPGTGKSNFIKHFLEKNKLKSAITYDESLMQADDFYLDFIRYDNDIMILEDSDILLTARDINSNKIMGKILNVSDGIISIDKKKFIFTANLQNKAQIDEALMRPGRCFKVLEFERLTREQAKVVAEENGLNLQGTAKTYSLAEIFNQSIPHTKTMGFK